MEKKSRLLGRLDVKAFTLIELLVVVLIIGILAAVALPKYQLAVDKTRARSMLLVLRHIREAENMYRLANGNYTLDFTELGIDLPIKSQTENNDSITTTDGTTYSLSSDGTYWHVNGYAPKYMFTLYWAFGADTTLCYPEGTERGRRLCKNLGCSDVSGVYCSFRP